MKQFIILSSNSPEGLTQQISKHQQQGNTIINTQFSSSVTLIGGGYNTRELYSVLVEYQTIMSTPQIPKNDIITRSYICIKCKERSL